MYQKRQQHLTVVGYWSLLITSAKEVMCFIGIGLLVSMITQNVGMDFD